MPIAPRFRRVAALQRPFLDRETILDAFDEELAAAGSGPRVLDVTGVGGIGKSRLLRHLEDRVRGSHRTATLDLQVPALRQQEDALAVLRGQFGEQDVRFDRFDIGYAVLWQRLHPHLRLSKAELPFVEASSVLSEVVDSVSGVPVFGTAIGLLKLLDKAASSSRRRIRISRDPTLETLDSLPNHELADAVTYLFAQDLREASADRPYVLFVDTYEALVPSPSRSGRSQLADSWLRDLIAQLDRGLVVVGGREPLGWGAYDPEWDDLIRVCRVDGLPAQSRVDLLTAGGIDNAADQREIAWASAGLPFYLNLAVDTFQQTGRSGGTLVSREEILGRFLQHVSPDEISSLEVLSLTRVFDFEIFRALTETFRLPGHRVAWNSLTAYSFVYPAGSGLRFHQLMGEALRRRLSPEAAAEIHALLRGIWDVRAAAPTAAGEDTARALREAAFHGTRAGQTGGADLLGYADRAVAAGGHSAASGIIDDLRAFLADDTGAHAPEMDGSGLARALVVLRAEAANRQGDAADAVALTAELSSAVLDGLAEPVAARLAVAAGNGRRIAGDTGAALRMFTQVWERGDGDARLLAGLWAADLHMCQGRFQEAETLADQLESLAPRDAEQFRGDLARLRHLACRFAFDFAGSARYLEEAAAHYAAADSVVGAADLRTNRAELLAVTDPVAAVGDAGRAIEVQREIGAHHELGKSYTAVAMAQLQRGHLDEAAGALRSAFAYLDRAGYRSGRARAELYQGCLQARRGHVDEAAISIRHAVEELEAADVYPTLVLCAARLLHVLDSDDPGVTAAAERAARSIQPLGSFTDLTDRIDRYAARLLGDGVWSPLAVYRAAAARTDGDSGFYNHNIRAATGSGPVIVRIPIPAADAMDLRIWAEPATLRAVRDEVRHVPRLLYARAAPRFQLHEYVDGQVLDAIAPRGTRVPEHVIPDVLTFLEELGAVPRPRIPEPPPGWPADGDTTGFARKLSAVTADVHRTQLADFGGLFADLHIPADPLSALEAAWDGLRPRPFRLLHTDIHRKNMIVTGGATFFLDWELALLGDPVYDLAVHLHKMAYQPDEMDRLVAGWRTGPGRGLGDGWEPDLRTYLAHERAKSAVVDAVRYTKLVTGGTLTAAGQDELIDKLTGKLAAAHAVWRVRRRLDRAAVAAAIRRWAAGRPGPVTGGE